MPDPPPLVVEWQRVTHRLLLALDSALEDHGMTPGEANALACFGDADALPVRELVRSTGQRPSPRSDDRTRSRGIASTGCSGVRWNRLPGLRGVISTRLPRKRRFMIFPTDASSPSLLSTTSERAMSRTFRIRSPQLISSQAGTHPSR